MQSMIAKIVSQGQSF